MHACCMFQYGTHYKKGCLPRRLRTNLLGEESIEFIHLLSCLGKIEIRDKNLYYLVIIGKLQRFACHEICASLPFLISVLTI